MPTEPTSGDIHAGDVSGTLVVGDNNHVTNTTHGPERGQPLPGQRNTAQDQAAVFAVEHGTMHVTYNAAGPEPEPAPEPAPEPQPQPRPDR
ncbi:hypothetical protein [Streptacidiphilus anmyonensis]|uniref:hypothetical protein n=1 Tax=Streptacidiphilus anmyonensis TaxID=405782 RepID=UPI0005A7B6AC|nr:hypothetical protein [Streptacidiphilus anmyonensis]